MITVLRLGHRPGRDSRVSTHLGLVARAFGADEIVYSGEKEGNVMDSVREVEERLGGGFGVRYEESWRSLIKEFGGPTVHLTVYGDLLGESIGGLRESYNNIGELLVVVGGQKVPGELYDLCDHNVAVTDQPHSEIGALAVFLWEMTGKQEEREDRDTLPPKSRLDEV